MMKTGWTMGVVLCVAWLLLVSPAMADWVVGDGHKMHSPQMPDPDGWDIDVLTDTVYDDFECAQSGPIDDVHFWVSWKGEDALNPVPGANITWIDISFHGDIPADQSGLGFSHPDSLMYGDPLWTKRFLPGEFTYWQDYGTPLGLTGDQGWFSPEEPTVIEDDHTLFHQINITEIPNAFVQEEGTIYWLGIHIGVADINTSIGWKTTPIENGWNDDATYWYDGGWNELFDPVSGESLDMAFVITPEPATLSLLVLGGMAALRRRRQI